MSTEHSDLHDEIVEILFELCNETKTEGGKPMYSSIYADHVGQKYKPIILITDIGRRKKPITKKYSPDVWAQVKGRRRYDIYEVWHTETEAEAVEDIIFSSLVGGIRYSCIVCTGKKLTSDNADELVSLIIHRICDEEGKKFLDPSNVLIADLPKKLWRNRILMKTYLKRKLQF